MYRMQGLKGTNEAEATPGKVWEHECDLQATHPPLASLLHTRRKRKSFPQPHDMDIAPWNNINQPVWEQSPDSTYSWKQTHPLPQCYFSRKSKTSQSLFSVHFRGKTSAIWGIKLLFPLNLGFLCFPDMDCSGAKQRKGWMVPTLTHTI